MITRLAAILLLVLPAPAATVELRFGRFVISVSDSWTAQLFHMVDMLAEWDQWSHRAYARWARENLVLDALDRRLLEKHAEMRRARGWGKGFEQAFLSEATIDGAAAQAVERGLLSAGEAESERAILTHFAPKLIGLRDQRRAEMEAFQARLQSESRRLEPWFQKLVAFTGTERGVTAPVFLAPNSEERSGGGEANGGRIVIEVPSPDPLGTLFHESLHLLLAPHDAEIQAAAASAGLTAQSLNEGIVYAMAPGLTDDAAETDTIAEGLARYLLRGTPASDGYVKSYMVANVLRPVLRGSIERGETLRQFLPKAVAKWRSFQPR